jgi:hypothetical protein
MTSLRVTSQAGILYRHPTQGALLYANPYNNQGNGVYLWQDGDLKPVYTFGTRLFDQTIQEVESGTVNTQGDVTLMLRGDGNPLMITRMNPTPYVLFGAGDQIPVELPVNAFTFIGGARTGPPHIQAGGNAGSIAEFAGGDWNLTLGIGERLFGNTMWFGGSHGSTYNMRKAPNGDIYFTSGAGIARISGGGAPQLVVPFPLRLDNNLTVNSPSQIDVNSQGALLFSSSTSAGDNRIYIYQNGAAKEILVHSSTATTASTIEDRIAQSFDSFAFDDRGRVLAQLRFRGLFAGLTTSAGGNIVAEWQDSGWAIAVNITTSMPNGQVANNISALDVNVRGDLLCQFSNGVTSMVLQRGGKFYQVHNFFRPTPEGDYLIRINAMDLRDDGTVYFLAATQADEVVLYEARPLF